MFRRPKETRVKSIDTKEWNKDDNFTLEGSLKPFWIISYYGAITLDWCKEFPHKSRISVAIRWIFLGIVFFSIFSGFGFEAYQLTVEITRSNSTISSIMPNLFWCSSYPTAIVASLVLCLKRKDFLAFFQHWADLEKRQTSILFNIKSHSKRMFYLVYGSYGIIFISGFVASYFLTLSKPEASYLLSYYQVLKDALTVPGVFAFHSLSLHYSWSFTVMADLVPAWTFYHASQILRSLSTQVEDYFVQLPSSTLPSIYQKIRNDYETLSRLTRTANRLLGCLTIVNYGVTLFLICSETYLIVATVRNNNLEPVQHLCFASIYVSRFAVSFWMTSQLNNESEEFSLSIAIPLADSKKLSLDDCKRWEMFLGRLRERPLVAKPLDLFETSPFLILTIVNVIITYVVVLIQSKDF